MKTSHLTGGWFCAQSMCAGFFQGRESVRGRSAWSPAPIYGRWGGGPYLYILYTRIRVYEILNLAFSSCQKKKKKKKK